MTIVLAVPGVVLRPLHPTDAEEYAALLQRNAVHLGPDYADELARPVAAHAEAFASVDPPLGFGIREHGILIGLVTLVPVAPPRYGLGYWLDAGHCGRGIATAAVEAVVDHAGTALAATDVFAGVSHGNRASERVLEKTGFARVERFAAYDRFHRAIVAGPRT